jgi:hypothetical protein
MSIIETLTEGMVQRNMQQEGAALLNKWSQTGLLEGLSNDEQKSGMARLLENQARELLRESNTMAGGDVEGFAAVAFPIVRRVFAGLIANDLVSVQPMSLPSGLIFFMDFTFGSELGGRDAEARLGQNSADSIYGQGIVGSEVTGGVRLNSNALDKQPYGLASAYSSPTGSFQSTSKTAATLSYKTLDTFPMNGIAAAALDSSAGTGQTIQLLKELEFDADVIAEHDVAAGQTGFFIIIEVDRDEVETAADKINMQMLSQIHAPISDFVLTGGTTLNNWNTNVTSDLQFKQVRRLTKYDRASDKFTFIYVSATALSAVPTTINLASSPLTLGSPAVEKVAKASYPTEDTIGNSSTGGAGAIAGGDFWRLEGTAEIPEIDIKVDSIAITAVTKKLKAKWTPELGQDLNAYHNLDAEVELTSILSEQIALEIDREILGDLVNGATAGTFYWSRSPGMFVNRLTGAEVGANTTTPDFTGTVSEWYETLIETINDVSAQIHRKTLRGGANFVVLSPEVANILEFTAGFRANITADADKGDIGAVKVGSLNRKFDVIVDPYFPRNAILVGRKGSSFLESGYVYAPYVPLQTTPTIFGPEDFVPRKGVMTRYGKKMVRPDMYGLVVVRDLLGGEGEGN